MLIDYAITRYMALLIELDADYIIGNGIRRTFISVMT